MKDGKKAGAVLGVGAAVTGLVLVIKKAFANPPIPPEEIELYGLSINPPEVYVGEGVAISLFARNIGGQAGPCEVPCLILYAGEVIKTMKKTVTLQPGEHQSVEFIWTPTEEIGAPTQYNIQVENLSGIVTVYPTPEAEFEVSNLTFDPPEVYVGEPVVISVTITNVGAAPGSYEVECIVE
jgi:hypothetical protein